MASEFEKQFKKIVKEKVDDIFKDIPRYVIEIGVWAGDEKDARYEFETKTNKEGEVVKRKEKHKSKSGKIYNVYSGVTNAEIMFIMEYGSKTKDIPSRPVLEKTIEYAKKELLENAVVEGLKNYVISGKISDFEKSLEKMCIRMENYAKTGIRRNTLGLEPNKPYTIEKKGSNVPLLDTGQLANSIRCKYRKV